VTVKLFSIPAAEIVPDDLFSLRQATRFRRCRPFKSKGTPCRGKLLTGESAPVDKAVGGVFDNDNSIGKKNILYGGTVIN
jgi:magnesium-transporting ATPase (P-type)